ncbi:MAG: YdcF family protein [Terriglobales bacterium]
MRRVLLIPLLVAAVALGYAGLVFSRVEAQARRDEARPADAIVVFGAAEYYGRPSPVLRARLDHALALYRRGLAPVVVTTGGAGGEWRYTEAGVARDYLLARGVPAAAIWTDARGYSTADAVAHVAAMLRAHGLRSLVIVSDGYHIYRVKRMFEARGFAAFGSPRPDPAGVQAGWSYQWLVCRQVVAYLLWQCGFHV